MAEHYTTFHFCSLIFAALILSGCVSSNTITESQALFGYWRLDGLEQFHPCSDGVLEFRSDSIMIARTGDQILRGRFSLEPHGKGFHLNQHELESNGARNCQGIDSDYVIDNYVYRSYIELRGNKLRIYLSDNPRSRYTIYERIPSEGGG